MKKHKLKEKIKILEDSIETLEKLYHATKQDLHLLATQPNSGLSKNIIERIHQEIRFNKAQEEQLMAGSPSTNLNNAGLAGMVDTSAGVASEPLKPKSILEGKVAIETTNEREHHLLMDHFVKLGWETENTVSHITPWPDFWTYKPDPCRPGAETLRRDGYTFVSFPAFAAEVGIEVPKFILTSEDGVDLYIGDNCFTTMRFGTQWALGSHEDDRFDQNTFTVVGTGFFNPPFLLVKFFSTKEAAEAWIAEQNKPKEVTGKLFRGKTVKVSKEKITIYDGDDIFYLYPSDIEDLTHALKSL